MSEKPRVERHGTRPYKIGVMIDIPGDCSASFRAGLTLAFEEAAARGVGDRPSELVIREYVSHPWRSGHANVDAYRDLVENENVLGVAGPMTSDNSLSVLPELSRHGVPLIAICGTQEFAGAYAFTTPNGGMADEPATIAAWLVSRGHRSIALIREAPSQIGEEYAHYLRYEATEHNLDIVTERAISPVASEDEIVEALDKMKRLEADCLVYFGFGALSVLLNTGLARIGWDPERIMGTAFVGAAFSRERAAMYEGWKGLDQFHEENPVLGHLLELYEEKFGKPKEFVDSVFTCAYDIGRAFSLGLARMRIATGSALRDALETVTRMPAATGAPGTVVSFSKRDHRGFKGADYLIIREAVGGVNKLVGRAPVEL